MNCRTILKTIVAIFVLLISYGIAETLPQYSHLKQIDTGHINYSLPSIVDDNYSGTHWLGSFVLYALNTAQ